MLQSSCDHGWETMSSSVLMAQMLSELETP